MNQVLHVVGQMDHVVHTPREEKDCGLGPGPRCGVGILVQTKHWFGLLGCVPSG